MSDDAVPASPQLTALERQWLDAHPVVRLGGDPGFAPFEYLDADGNYRGIVMEYLELLGKMLGVKFQVESGGEWRDTVRKAKAGDLDGLACVGVSEERRQFFLFTRPYLTAPQVVFSRKGGKRPASEEEMGNLLVGVQDSSLNHIWVSSMKDSYPILYPSAQEAFLALSAGEIDVVVDNLSTATWIVDQYNLGNVEVAFPLADAPQGLAIGVSKNLPELATILDKALAAIPRDVALEIQNRGRREAGAGSGQARVELTTEEEAWIAAHPEIDIAVMAAWPPLNFVDNEGRPAGIGVDVIRLLAERVGLDVKLQGGAFGDNLNAVREGRLDGLMDVTPKPERAVYLNFTEPYLNIPHVIIGRAGDDYFYDESLLDGNVLALEKGFGNVAYFRERHPRVKILELEDTSACLAAVSTGRADAYAGNRAVATYLIAKELLTNLQVQGKLRKPGSILSIGLRKDEPLLVSILDKALDSMTPADWLLIQRRWTGADANFRKFVPTAEQAKWLESHGDIRVGVEPGWMPYSDVAGERFEGVLAEYVSALSGKLGVSMTAATGISWQTAMDMAAKGQLDVVAGVTPTPERQRYLRFTKPFLQVPVVLVTRDEALFIRSLDDLRGKRVAVVRGRVTEEYLRTGHPKISVLPRETLKEALGAVREGDADAMMDDMGAITYAIKLNDMKGLIVAATTEYELNLAFGVRKDWPELVSILNEALKTIPEAERRSFFDRWVNVHVETQVDWLRVWLIVLGVAAVGGAVLWAVLAWNRRLAREVAERTAAERKLQAMSGAVHDAMVMINGQAEVKYWNLAAEQMFGITAEEALGGDLHDLVGPEWSREAAREGLAGFRETGQGAVVGSLREIVAIRGDGTEFPAELAVSSFRLDDGWYAVGTIRDLTRRKEAERQLTRLYNAVEQSPVSILITDTSGKIEYVNPYFTRLTGYAAEEVIGRNPRILKSGGHDAEFYGKMWETITRGEIWTGEIVNRKKNGELHWENATISPLKDEDGNIASFLAVKQDVTDRKLAEQALAEAQEDSRLILESVGEGVMGVDAEGRIIFVNPTGLKLLGYGQDELMGADLHRTIHHSRPDGSPYPAELCPVREAYSQGRNCRVADECLWRKDGTGFAAEYTAVPMRRGGMTIGAVLVFQDITARRQAEEALREKQRQLRAIIDNLPSMVALKDREGRYLMVNEFFEEAVGVPVEAVLGKTDAESLPPEAAGPLMAVDREVLESGRMRVCEEEVPHPDGTVHTYLTTKVPLQDETGEVDKLVVLATDITGRRRMERELVEAKNLAEEATRAKSDFLANMSHEIRTPMNAILGMSHLAMQTELSPKQVDYLGKIDSSAKALLRIINDILDFSKIEAGRLEVEKTGFHLEEVLDSLVNLVGVPAQEKGLELLVSVAPGVHENLVGDPLRLGQILTNLAGNAVKFTESGEIHISVEEVESSDDDVLLSFEVRDTGMGMTGPQMEKLFTAFTQADVSTTRKFGGTGLGLTISKQLVAMMGGEIGVTSEKGVGSTFRFTVRFGLLDKPLRRFKVRDSLKGMKILVVDDNLTSREILSGILRSFDFKVDTVSGAAEALDRLEAAEPPYRLVLMDWRMPGMDGIEASRRIKENRHLKDTPTIIMITAYGREEVMQQADNLGLEGILLKPVSQSVLFNTIMEVFGESFQVESRAKRGGGMLAEAREKAGGARVLLAEDNSVNRQVATEILEQAGLFVSVAENGGKAVELAGREDFDIILMDIQMPEMDGFEATRIIRESARNSGTPILAMTAHAMSGDEEKSLRAGMDGHLTKPIDVDKLYGALIRWVRGKGGPEQALPEAGSDESGAGLPESLPGFDLDAGLARVGGNEKLYRKLLLELRNDYVGTPGELRQALANRDFPEASHLAHALKGVAGNLGAERLQETARAVEAAATAGTDFTAELDAFDEVFGEAVRALAAIPDAGDEADKGALPASFEMLIEALEEMRQALRTRKPKLCREALERMKALQWPESLRKEFSRVGMLVGKYDFKAALSLVESMDDKLKE
ncbi:transporter substrate-binding domain-containing protein [Pseudodesulfovibrio thermohalotolerans]|uniref:PAS domain S-box protein n=1 Tax=Pseudodesulfovibrio thermohalotolerans TaxID=2880651 RepID=UPI002442EB61|nr:transporter substrate-binding domain-containing protein [Pseudodesulfovibrio thermohalotolerans]WFS62758.1 transporter substrate-binding domain-containing protein [Pseudodesulfovibrio thermohalotolerans]